MANVGKTLLNTLKVVLRTPFRVLGFDIVRTRQNGAEPAISGTFPPHKEYFCVGLPEHYFIHDGYRHRSAVIYFDDTEYTDEWQREVYRFAREVFDQKHLTNVCDIGCGSAYKLVRYFTGCNFVGLDVAETCEWLRKKHPNLTWMELDFNKPPLLRADLVIAADVIEHVLNPDDLLSCIVSLNPKYVVLSTPDRNLLRAGTHNGPPRNPAHIREWNFVELEAYLGDRFEILEHFISNGAQATQCLLCIPRRTK